MEDDVGLTDQWRERSWVADIPMLQPVPRIEIRGSLAAVTVNLWLEIVEQNDFMASLHQGVGEVRADEPSPAGDQDALAHAFPFCIALTVRQR